MPVAEITLTPEQQTHVDGLLAKATEDAVTKFKTESEEARKKAVPDKYEFKFTDGSPLDPAADAAAIAEFAKKQGLTGEQAQAYVAQQETIAAAVLERQKAAHAAQVQAWGEETKNDKELGGTNWSTTLKWTKLAMDRLHPAGDPFREFLETSGFGNHRHWVAHMAKIGKMMAEDTGGGGSGGGKPAPKTNAEVFYPEK